MKGLVSSLLAMAIGLWSAPAAASPEASSKKRVWVNHVVVAKETLAEIGQTYDVTPEQLVRWNDLGSVEVPRYERGDVFRVYAARFAPPRQKVKYKVSDKQTWEDVAKRFGISVVALRKWNSRYRRKLPKGAVVYLYAQSSLPGPGSGPHGPPVPSFKVRDGGYSAGRPARGRLIDGVQLPKSDLYTIRFGRLAYGTSLAVEAIQRGIATFRRETGFPGTLAIGAMSRRVGRRLRPHRSHQSGRDIDIRLPAMPFADGEADLQTRDIDWYATWGLVSAMARMTEVQVIFLERKLFRRVRKAAKVMGASEAATAKVMAKVRHSKGHTAHIHVRFECSPRADRCRD